MSENRREGPSSSNNSSTSNSSSSEASSSSSSSSSSGDESSSSSSSSSDESSSRSSSSPPEASVSPPAQIPSTPAGISRSHVDYYSTRSFRGEAGYAGTKGYPLLAVWMRRVAWRQSRLFLWLVSTYEVNVKLRNLIRAVHLLFNMFSYQEQLGAQHWRVFTDGLVKIYEHLGSENESSEAEAVHIYVESMLKALFEVDANIRRSCFLIMALWNYSVRSRLLSATELHSLNEKLARKNVSCVEYLAWNKLLPLLKTGFLSPTLPQFSSEETDVTELLDRLCDQEVVPLVLQTVLFFSSLHGQTLVARMLGVLRSLALAQFNPAVSEAPIESVCQNWHVCSDPVLLEAEILLRLQRIEAAVPDELDARVQVDEDRATLAALAPEYLEVCQCQANSIPFVMLGPMPHSYGCLKHLPPNSANQVDLLNICLRYSPLEHADWAALFHLLAELVLERPSGKLPLAAEWFSNVLRGKACALSGGPGREAFFSCLPCLLLLELLLIATGSLAQTQICAVVAQDLFGIAQLSDVASPSEEQLEVSRVFQVDGVDKRFHEVYRPILPLPGDSLFPCITHQQKRILLRLSVPI